ncbi:MULTISPECIES: hypothetical protein [Exiguobacterium]|uniref:hypothetical protein n=1 Tax=Exiguobacterium TaxID=33986 RepID=UPI001BE8E4D4|nr:MULTISPECIES: hypothetical protein [Exiguobacterium]MCT4776467.1 hypothetical protein [Exiguobacterium aquaticum]MCT4788287.1 hypothetical protein [Exiguobacterium mexicanum]
MNQRLFRLGGILGLSIALITTPALAAETEKTPEAYADQHFEDIVLDHIQEGPALYDMTTSENLSFGPLHPVMTPSRTYMTSEEKFPLGEALEFTNEYVAVVYQDDVPVNVIGTYEVAEEEYGFSTFGYGQELAIALDALDDQEGDIVYQAQRSAWFEMNGETMIPLTPGTKTFVGEETISLTSYKELAGDLYTAPGEPSDSDLVGGAPAADESATPQELRRYGIAFLASIPLIYLVFRRRIHG